MFAKLLDDRRGAVAILFGLTAVIIFMAAGFAIDMVRAVQTKAKVQAATDSAALAANYEAVGKSDAEVIAATKRYLEGIVDLPDGYGMKSEVTLVDGKVIVRADVDMPTYFGKFAGINHLDIGVESETVVGKTSFDVVMVLDNSGSMHGSKLHTLKRAAEDLSETLFEINEKSDKKDRVKIGLVPFTAWVNVGPDKRSAAWIDSEGRSPIHWNGFAIQADGKPDPAEFDSKHFYNGRPSRLTLFDQLKHTDWLGCVMARPIPYDVTDTPASSSVPATLYVPEFAPDEPDDNWRFQYRHYDNTWTNDEHGACRGGPDPVDAVDAQERLCKYLNQPKAYGNSYTKGPNYNCKSEPVTALTTSKRDISNAIRDMKANGNTNIHQGIVWGWRVLSPQEPFTGGREIPDENSDEEHKRFLIVMSDGANTYGSASGTHNITRYEAYGFGTEERLGNGIDQPREIAEEMDERTAIACENAKNDGEIEIFTVAFQITDQNTKDMMRRCATRSDMAFTADSNSDLVQVFERIAEEITKLRLSR